jgi:hypothetical protein
MEAANATVAFFLQKRAVKAVTKSLKIALNALPHIKIQQFLYLRLYN